jgi:hypothetical protein
VILLEDTLTKGEKQSVAKGHADAVSGQTRRHSLDPATRLQRFNRRRVWAGPDMAKRMTWTVEPRQDGRWAVQRDGTRRAASLHDRQDAAVARGTELGRRHQGQLRIKGSDGRLLEEMTYGRDPFPPRG